MADNSNKEKLIEQAQKLVEKGQYDKAVREYLKVVSEDDNDIRIWIRIGDLYVKLGQKNEAVANYKKVANLYIAQNDPEKAIAVYKQILSIDNQHVEGQLALGGLYRDLGRLQQATQQYEAASQLLFRQGKVRDALRADQAIVDMAPDNVARRIKLAEQYSKENMVGDAAREFGAAASFLRNAGRTEDFVRVAERLLFHAPENVEVTKDVARHYLQSKDAVRALGKLQSAFKVSRGDPEVLDLLAESFVALNKADKATSVLKELARLYSERGALSAANSVHSRILALDPNDAEAKAALTQGPTPIRRPDTKGKSELTSNLIFNSPEPRAIPSGGSGANALPTPTLNSGARPLPPVPLQPRAIASSISARVTPAAGSVIATTPATPEEEANRVVAEVDSFLRFGLAKKAQEHLLTTLQNKPQLRPVRERLAKLYESQGNFRGAIAELRILLEQGTTPQEEAGYLREILRLDTQDQSAQARLKKITAVYNIPPPMDIDEPEISIDDDEHKGRRLGGDKPESSRAAEPDPATAPSAITRPNADEVAAAAEEMALTSGTLKEELDEVEFFLQQRLLADARRLLQSLASRYPHSRTVQAKLKEVASSSSDEGVIPVGMDDVDEEDEDTPSIQVAVTPSGRSLPPSVTNTPPGRTIPPSVTNTPPGRTIPPSVANTPPGRTLPPSIANSPPGRTLPPSVANSPPGRTLPPPGRSLPGPISQTNLPALSPSGRSLQGPGVSGQVPAVRRSIPPPPPRPSGLHATIPPPTGTSTPAASPFATPNPTQKTAAAADASGAFRLGVSYRNRGQFGQAISEFEKAMHDPKRGARAALMTGLCHRDQNQLREAVEAFKEGVHTPGANDADIAELHYQLGRTFELLEDTKEAIHFYQQAIKRDGRYRDAGERITALKGAGTTPGRPAK